MTVGDWLKEATILLSAAGIETARLDALVLLEDVVGQERSYLLAHTELELSSDQVARLTKLLTRRAQHEPLAYLRGYAEFYGREFVVSPAVLVPRPESETMIELLKGLVRERFLGKKEALAVRIADVGAGSGALGITAALELSEAVVELLEIDRSAIEIAQINVDKLTSGILITESDLLAGSGQNYDILLCNLPYVPDDYDINTAARHEPKIALFGGPDGLNLYRRLFKQVRDLPHVPLFILTEALPEQHQALEAIAKTAGYTLDQKNDFIQLFSRIH